MTSTHPPMPLAATTFGFLYREELAIALDRIREAGYEQVELAAGPPHVDLSVAGRIRCAASHPAWRRQGSSV